MLLDVLDEICETDVGLVLYVAVFSKEAATANGSDSTLEERGRLSGGEDSVRNELDGEHVLIRHGSVVLSFSEADRCVCSEASSV